MSSTHESTTREVIIHPGPAVEATADRPGRAGRLSEWTFDAITWAALRAGRLGPLRRARSAR